MTKHSVRRPTGALKAPSVSWAAPLLLGATLACGAPLEGETRQDWEDLGQSQGALTFAELCLAGPRSRTACTLIVEEVNRQLSQQSLRLDNRGLIYNFDDPSTVRAGGGGCSPLDSTRRTAQVTLKREARLDLNGDALTEPLVFGLQLPVDLAATAHMKQRNGIRQPFGGCVNLPSDGYRINARGSTQADVVVSFWLNPSFVRESATSYEISVKPILRVDANVDLPRLSTSTSGVNPVSTVFRGLSGLASFVGGSAETIIKGHGLKALEQDLAQAGFDLGNVFLNDGPANLIGKARDGVIRYLVTERLKDETATFKNDLEASLNRKVSTALGLNASGRRAFVVDLVKREVRKPAPPPGPDHECDRNSDCGIGFICDPIGPRGARQCCEPEDDGSCI